MIPIFAIIIIGAAAKLLKIADDSWVHVLNKVTLNVFFPALLLNDMLSLDTLDGSNFVFNTIFLLAAMAILFLLGKVMKFNKKLHNTYTLAVFGNVAYLGYPIITSLFPGDLSLIIGSYTIVLFSVGIMLLDMRQLGSAYKTLIDMAKNPLLLSILAGLALRTIIFPQFIYDTLKMLAGAASPSALLALGIFLPRKIDFSDKLVHAISISMVKLLIIPFALIALGADRLIIMEGAMPLAISLFALSEEYPLDKEVILYTLIISTTLSIITIPVLASLL